MVQIVTGNTEQFADNTPAIQTGFGLYVARNAFVAAHGLNADAIKLTGFGSLQVHGEVVSATGTAVAITGSYDVVVGRDGLLGGFAGIQFNTSSGSLINYGQIISQVIAVNFFTAGAGNYRFENHGYVASDSLNPAVRMGGSGSSSILNTGTISGGITSESGAADTVTNSGDISGNILLYGGDDLYDGSLGRVSGGNIEMGAGNDIATGGASREIFFGGEGNDELAGGGGNDIFRAGNSSFSFGGGMDGNDSMEGGAGFDIYDASESTAAMVVNLAGGSASGALIGQDTLLDMEGAVGGSALDKIFGNTLANRLWGNDGNDQLKGGSGNDQLFGGGNNDNLQGEEGNDRIDGGDGRDNISGGGGNDVIYGSYDTDVMAGGTGSDVFDFNDQEETYRISTAGALNDIISDFVSGEDMIDFSTIDPGAAFGDQAFSFIGTAAFSAVGQIRYRQTATNTFVEVSISTSSGPSIELQLTGVMTLTAADFIL